MKYIRNQCGYAMVEVIIIITLIAVIAAIVLPNINNSFKSVYVNYEMLNLYGEMRFIKSANRLTNYNKQDIFLEKTINEKSSINFSIKSDNKKQYALYNSNTPLREHTLSPNFLFETKLLISATYASTISNAQAPNANGFTLRIMKDSQKCNPVIVVNSVGRIRFNRE